MVDAPGERLLIKLWDTIADRGIANLFKPWQMRREGRVTRELKSEEIIAIAQAEQYADRIRRGELILSGEQGRLLLYAEQGQEQGQAEMEPTPSWHKQLPRAVSGVIVADVIRREVNVTRALLHAEEALAEETAEPVEANVDEDWLHRWRDSASQVSTEELQNLWGRLLAGEVKSPGTFSLRTLEFIRNLSKSEAEQIALLLRFVIGNMIIRDANEILAENGAHFGLLFAMQSIGVVAGAEAVGLSVTWVGEHEGKFLRVLNSHSRVLIVRADDPKKSLKLSVYKVTDIGQDLIRLGSFEPHLEYLRFVGDKIKAQGFDVELAEFESLPGNEVRCFNIEKL